MKYIRNKLLICDNLFDNLEFSSTEYIIVPRVGAGPGTNYFDLVRKIFLFIDVRL